MDYPGTQTRTTSNRIKVTDVSAISVDAYGFYTIVQGKPRLFRRLWWPVTIERGGAYAVADLRGHSFVYFNTI